MLQRKHSITWVPTPHRGICGNMFGLISMFCIAQDLKITFYANWNLENHTNMFKLNDSLTPKNVAKPDYIKFSDQEAMVFFENEDIEDEWKHKHIIIQNTQNLYQHFCYKRPQHDYKNNLLFALTNCFKYLFMIPSEVITRITHVRTAIGIHVNVNSPTVENITDVLLSCKKHIETQKHNNKIFICSKHYLTFSLAKSIFGTEFTLIFNDNNISNNILLDLIHLTRCKTLYISWNSNFSRLGAIINPYRDIYSYNHPDYSPDMYKCVLDELLSYYKNPIIPNIKIEKS